MKSTISTFIFVLYLTVVLGKFHWAKLGSTLNQREVSVEVNSNRLNNVDTTIFHGVEVKPHSIKYAAGLILHLVGKLKAFCGGCLITKNYVLSAAHCIDQTELIEVVLGAHNISALESSQIRLNSTNFIVHPNWNVRTFQHDIALIKLPRDVLPNEYINYVRLPSQKDLSKLFVGQIAVVSGWESTKISPVLRKVANHVITNQECMQTFRSLIHKSQLCVSGFGGKSACYGDSGGPLTVNMDDGSDVCIGITSFGILGSCEKIYPVCYTRITWYMDWILRTTGLKFV